MSNDMLFPIEGADYFIVLKQLPPKIFAYIRSNGDSTFTLVLDPRRDFWHWVDDWEHEMWHLIHDDLFSDTPVWVLEAA